MIYTDAASIKQVQSAINAGGYQPPLVVDGLNGPKTILGVKWFETQHGLTPDGVIGPLVMAATIAPTPGQAAAAAANPLAALTAQISQLAAVAPSAPAPLVPTPVTSMLVAPGVPPPGGTSSPGILTPSAYKPIAIGAKGASPSGLMGNVGGIPIPALIGAVVGAGLGVFGGLVWILAGAAGGGAAGYGFTMLSPQGATMHGEDDVDFCLEADYGCDEPTVVAGEIGCEVATSQLKG